MKCKMYYVLRITFVYYEVGQVLTQSRAAILILKSGPTGITK